MAQPITDSPTGRNNSEYVLGTGTTESVRLGLQHRLWSALAHQLWERANLQPGHTVLDLGCGPGHATVDLAQIVGPTGRVIAIDESAAFLKQVHDEARARNLTNITRVLGDVQDLDTCLPGSESSVDLAYARWVFCFLARPEDVIAGLARVIKPGGKLTIQDYFSYESMTLAPRRDAFTKVINAIGRSWRSRGGDPDIVGRLPAMLSRHGFEVVHIMANQRVARPGTTMWHWPASFWSSYIPRLREFGFISASEQDQFEATWRDASEDPDTFMVLPTVFDVVAVKR